MAQVLPDPSLPWPICIEGVYLIADSEKLRLRAYLCPAGVWTVGWGETDGVGPKTAWTKKYADQRFCDSLAERTEAVRALCTVSPSDNQLAALVSLSYNIGVKALASSTALKRHNAGDFEAAARAFSLWNKAKVNGKLTVLSGLTTRRAREAALYLTPDHDEAPVAMPQAVAPESSMLASPINQAGAVTGVTGALGLMSQVSDQASQASGLVSTVHSAATQVAGFLGLTPTQLIWAVLLVAGATIVYQRCRQRFGGWA